MFDQDYNFKGRHALYVKALVNEFDSGKGDKKIKLFDKNIDVYALAAVVGFTYNKTAKRDSGQERTNILASAFLNNKSIITSNYRMIMLLHDKQNIILEERVARAFRYDANDEKRKVGDEIFDSYVLGGVEKLFEKVFGTLDITSIDLNLDKEIQNIYMFLEELEMRYTSATMDGDIIDLCKLASD